jgi:SAM-dependent methyltransferase
LTAEHDIFDRALLRKRQDRVADHGAQHQFLLAAVADDLVERLSAIQRVFPIALNLGAHNGLVAEQLRDAHGIELVINSDASERLLQQCAPPRVRADEEALPFRDQSLDLVISALALQFVNDLPGTLLQIRRALKPDGLFLGAMVGGNTLTELRGALLEAEDEIEGGASPRVAPFADVRDVGALLQRAEFALPVADSHTITATYTDALALMRDLRGMGATNVLRTRRRAPLRRATLARAIEIYADRFGLPNGRVRATFEIVTMTGWAPDPSQQRPLQPGSAKRSLADALGTKEQSAGDAIPLRRGR